ncbi:hypothetical protein ACLOJK_016391 [Asimina triloba]
MALRRAISRPLRFIFEDECADNPCLPKCYPCPYLPPPPPSPPPPPFPPHTKHHISLLVIITSVLSTVFILLTCYAVIRRYWRRRAAGARTLPDQINTFHREDHDEGQNSIHYIWYVTTPGLDESVIKSIAVVKYKDGDGLIDGTECAVCLGEFQEAESLRLLPKCNHAFHIPCIDTWLRSHVSCPLCRANVVSGVAGANSSGVAEETQAGDSRRITYGSDRFTSGRSSIRPDELESERDEERRDLESAKDRNFPDLNRGFRVQSDLAHGYRSGERGLERLTDDEAQPFRRSVSMDSSAAAMIVVSVGNLLAVDSEGSSSSSAVTKSSGMKRIVPKHGRSQSFFKLMGCYSKGSFLQTGPVAMKRSFSAGGKFLLSRHSRSRSAALPL